MLFINTIASPFLQTYVIKNFSAIWASAWRWKWINVLTQWILPGLLIYEMKGKIDKSNIVVGGSIECLSETKIKKGKLV